MADLELLSGAQLPDTAQVRYKEIAPNVYALVVATETELVTNITVEGVPITLLTDEITGALVDIPVVHHEVHHDATFQISYKNDNGSPIADDGDISILLITGSRYNHLTISVAAGGDCELLFYEGVTVTNAGTALTVNNMKRYSAEIATTAASHTPTVNVAAATILLDVLIPGGTGGNSQGTSIGRQETEWILSLNTIYLIRSFNRAGNAQPMSLLVQWYEKSTA